MRSKELRAKAFYVQAHAQQLNGWLLKFFFLLVTFMMMIGFANAQPVNAKPLVNVNDKGVILDGYDAVAFFTGNKPVQGDAAFQYKYEVAVYYFASQQHLDMVKENPEKYKPQFGAYCAYAV